MNSHNIVAFQLAEHIQIKDFAKAYSDAPVYSDSFELLYEKVLPQKPEDNQYIYILPYGAIVFVNHDEVEMSRFLEFTLPYCKNVLTEKYREEFQIKIEIDRDHFGYNDLIVSRLDIHVWKIILLNLAQSVAIYHFAWSAEQLLEETNAHTSEMERTGKLKMSDREMRMFIAKTLNIRNRIADNLYILDAPAETWEDEYLNKIDRGLKNTFDISVRYRSIKEDLEIIKENLDLFKDLMHHRKSSMLEWIIILLILVEVLQVLIEKIFF